MAVEVKTSHCPFLLDYLILEATSIAKQCCISTYTSNLVNLIRINS